MSPSTQSAPPLIAGIGELLWDILPSGARLGGAPANFSLLSARLGNQALLVTSRGDDAYGRDALPLLALPGLDLTHVQLDPLHPTGTVEVTFSAAGQPVYVITEGVAWDHVAWTAPLEQSIHAADAICYGTLFQRSAVSRATLQRLIAATRPSCLRVCDVNIRMPWCQPDVLRASLAHATLIKVSDEELPVVFSMLAAPRPGSSDPASAAAALLAAFPQATLIAITLGPHGCLLADRTATAAHPGFPIQPVDTVGAGDAFTAGITHAWLRGASLARMAEIGNLCGSFVATQHGATPVLPPSLTERIAALLEHPAS